MSYNNNTNNDRIFGYDTDFVTLKHLVETFGNENPRQAALLPQFYKDRQSHSSKVPILQKEKAYFTLSIKKAQRKQSSAKSNIKKPQLLKTNASNHDQINETLTLYGQLLRQIFDNPSLLSPIYYNPAYKLLDPIVKLLTEVILSNQFDETHEHILTNIMEDIMQYEFDKTEDLTTYLRENTAATKLLSAYLKREPVQNWVNDIVEEACAHCLQNEKEDLEIDPSAIWEKTMNNLNTKISLRGPDDPKIKQMCFERRERLKEYVDFILSKIMNAKSYPIGLRIVCRKLKELAISKNAQNERLKNSLIGGTIFLRIFNPKIAYYGKLKSQHEHYKKYSGVVRRKFTLISKILQNISNQVKGGVKEKWMGAMNKYIVSKCDSVSNFFEELTAIPPLTDYFALDSKILANSPDNESVYISIKDLQLLTTMIDEYKQKKAKERKKIITNENKHFYALIKDIQSKKMFELIQKMDYINKEDLSSYFVQINIPKPLNMINDEISNKEKDKNKMGLELNLKIKVVPVLRELWNKDQLMNYLINLVPRNLVDDTINYLQFAQQSLNMSDLSNAMNVLISYQNPKITTSLLVKLYNQSRLDTEIFNRLNSEVKAMKKYEQKLEKEVKHLEVEYERIKREQAENERLAQQQNNGMGMANKINLFRLINSRNIDSSNNHKKNGQNDANSQQKQVETDVSVITENIVATDGMIGNMLLTLVRDVGQSMAQKFKSGYKNSNKQYIDLWADFPQNIPSYFPIIQRVARLGKMCMNELISTIIEADNDNARSKDPTKRFKLTILKNHISNNNDIQNRQICDYVIDFIMIDILQHCMKWITPAELYVVDQQGKYNSFHTEVTNKCISKFKTIPCDKIGGELAKKWKLKRLRKWGVLISILSPVYPEIVVDNFKLCHNAMPKESDGFLFGASYIRFNCDVVSVPTMQLYFDWIHTLILKNKSNLDKLRLIMLTLEHNIRAMTITNEIYQTVYVAKIQMQCFAELFKTIAKLQKNYKKETLTSPWRRLRSTMILREPPPIIHNQAAPDWLDALVNFKLSEKKNLEKASDLLHFLRGGGSSWDESIKRRNQSNQKTSAPSLYRKHTSYMAGYGGMHDDGNPILEQTYGRVEPRLQLNSTLCEKLCLKLFKASRKYDRNRQAVIIFMLSACAIQLCVHNFQYAITNVIQEFTKQDKEVSIERLFIAVYALNFVCLPECKFTEFMKVKIIGAKSRNAEDANKQWREMHNALNEEKRKLNRQLKALFDYLGNKTMPISKHLLTTDDARQDFSADTLNAQDEKLMFQQHVSKMMLFDWTDTPMEKYMLPIQNIETELLIYCLRLAPHIECEQLWEATQFNCSATGNFIGKWLLHKDQKVREQVLRTLLVAMKNGDKRSIIMKCFMEMLLHKDWQTPACLTMILKTVTHLLDHYRKLVVLDEESKKRHGARMGLYQQGINIQNEEKLQNDSSIDPLRMGKELPQWFSWQNRADALGLVLLCHYHTQVRLHALEFLNKITQIYQEFSGVGGGSVYIQKHTLNAIYQSSKRIKYGSIHRTVGGLIATHGRSIARMATMKYEEEQQSDNNADNVNNAGRRNSAYQPQTANINFSQCIHQWGLIPFCISQLAKRVANSHLHETILCAVDTLRYTLQLGPPSCAASKDKTGWSSQQEWQGNSFIRGHWISLHTLFFSIIGRGLSNPFSVTSLRDLELLKNEMALKNDSYALTSKQFEGYLDEFWFCLYEESLWVRDAVNAILQESNWESIPIVIRSIHKAYQTAIKRKKRGKNIISDTVYLLRNLSEIAKFAAGIYIGGENIVKMCFGAINSFKKEAFKSERIEKKRWWETQTEVVEFYAFFQRSLSKIGAHNELRRKFWAVEFKQDAKNNKSISEIRKTWLQKKNHVASGAITKDPMPHIKRSKTEERFKSFKWLLDFLVAVDNVVTPFVDPQDARDEKQRKVKVRRAVFQGLQYLLNMGSVIPTHKLKTANYIINLLRGTKGIDADFMQNYSLASGTKNKCILQVFIEAESDRFEVLTPLLTFQFESLISFYIEQASSHQSARHLFFRAIVNVIHSKNGGVQRLIASESGSYGKNNDWKIARPRGNGFLESVFHYAHKLLFLGFIMIIEQDIDTRYSGYLLLRSMADILCGPYLVNKLDKLKFAFESTMSLWVRKNGILISAYFANAYPALGSQLFRVCIQYAEDKDRADWISAFLKPWATVIHLMPDTVSTKIPPFVEKYNQFLLDNDDNLSSNDILGLMKHSQSDPHDLDDVKSNANNNAKQPSNSIFSIPSKIKKSKNGRHKYSESTSWSGRNNVDKEPSFDKSASVDSLKMQRKTHQHSKHETFALLSRIFDSTVEAKDDLQTSFLKVWTDLSQAFPYENLFAILDFILKKVEEAKKLQMQTFKSAILPTVKNIFFAVYEPSLNRAVMIVYIIRIILKILQIGSEDYRISALEKKERAGKILTILEQKLAREEREENNGKITAYNTFEIWWSEEILNINSSNNPKHKPLRSPSSSHKQRQRAMPKQSVGIKLSPNSNGNQSVNKGKNEQKEEEKRASIAAALLVELIGVDCEPIKPYFPVLVLYAALYIDKHSNHSSMHNLLVRLIVTLSNQRTIEEIEKNTHSIDDNKPSLAAALTSKTLELLWDEDEDSQNENNQGSKKQFVHNQGDYVAIDGATFVREYCSQFESIHKPKLRTGYEALRWAVLSTNPEITTRSFHIYRQLLNPLNHCTVKVMLLALCGAIDNWEASERSDLQASGASFSVSGSISIHSVPSMSHSPSSFHKHSFLGHPIPNARTQEYRETMRCLDTLIKMAEKLKETKEISEYGSFVWTGIALIRANVKNEKQKQVFIKGLELLNIVLDDSDFSLQYLFVNSYSINRHENLVNELDNIDQSKRKSQNSMNAQMQIDVMDHHNQYATKGGSYMAPLQQSGASQNEDISLQQSSTRHGGGGTRGNHAPSNSMNSSYWMGDEFKLQSQRHHTPSLKSKHTPQNEPDWHYELDEYEMFEASYSNNDWELGQNLMTDMGPLQPVTHGQLMQNNEDSNESNDDYLVMKSTPQGPNKSNYSAQISQRQRRVNYDVLSSDLAETFLAFCIEWAPPFEGIHPYLLQGLLQRDIEDRTFQILKKVLCTKMDKLTDRSSARPCLCVVAILPFMYYIIRHRPEYFATISHSLFESLILLTSINYNHRHNMNNYNPYKRLKSKFEFWSNCPINNDNANVLLKEICVVIVQTFFADHAGLVANYLYALLSSPQMSHHHTTVYKMATLFLNEDANYIQAFNDIIVSAHKTVSEKQSDVKPIGNNKAMNANDRLQISEMADAATELVATGIDYLKARQNQSFTKNFDAGDWEQTGGGPNGNNGTFGANDESDKKEIVIRWDVHINDITPFPQTGLKDVSNALWGVVKETRATL